MDANFLHTRLYKDFMHLRVRLSAEAFKFEQLDFFNRLPFFEIPCNLLQ
jgi:hypothetical protein